MNDMKAALSALGDNLKTNYHVTLSTLNSENFIRASIAYRYIGERRKKSRPNVFKEIFCNDSPLEFGQVFTSPEKLECIKLSREGLAARLLSASEGAYLLTSNDFSLIRALSPEFSPPENCFVIGWDFDSHQDVNSSIDFHAYCDLYFCAHSTYIDLLTELVGKVAYPLPLGSLQWSLEFLYSQDTAIWGAERGDALVGEHGRYEHYARRNYVVETIGKRHPKVQTNSNLNYHLYASESAKLAYWLQSKVHFCYPTNFEVPLRVFDCGITGSVALLPESSRHIVSHQVTKWQDFVVFFDPYSEVSISRALDLARIKFDKLRLKHSTNLGRAAYARCMHINQRLDRIYSFMNLNDGR